MSAHYEVPLMLAAAYIGTSFGGQHAMRTRAPVECRGALAAWNFLLSGFSAAGFVWAAQPMLRVVATAGFREESCTNTAEWANPAVMLFCLSKIPELLDTAFIVLRKKSLIFLHWYHHATVLLFCWDAWASRNPVGSMFAVMNMFVHTVMYFYYGCIAMGVRVAPPLRKSITLTQISQMAVGMSITVHNIAVCNTHPIGNSMGLVMYTSYFVLFCHFWWSSNGSKMTPKVKPL